MAGTPSTPARTAAVRVALVVLGAAVIAYAASDHPFYGSVPGFGKDQAVIAALGLAIAAGGWLPPVWAKRVLLLALSSFVTLAVVETAANALLSPRYRAPYDYSERYLFELRPDTWSEFTHLPANGGNSVLHHINSQGYRGEELRPPGEAVRVVVYGDSFIHAPYTPLEETFAEQLEDQLEERLAAPVEVVNAGTSSYGPDQIMLRMEEELDALAPDLVIIAIFAGNDFGDLIRNKMFRVDDDGKLISRSFSLKEELQVRFQLSHRESILRLAARKLRAATTAGQMGAAEQPSRDDLLKVAADEFASYQADDVVTEPSIDRYTADNSLLPNSEAARYKVRLMEAVLSRAVDIAGPVPLALLFIPHPSDVLNGGEYGPVDRERFPDYRPTNLTDSLEGIAERIGADYVNLFDVFHTRREPRLYLRGGDDHWNSAGQALAAELMANHIMEAGLLDGAVAGKGQRKP